MMKSPRFFPILLIILLFLFLSFFTGCNQKNMYFLSGYIGNKDELRKLIEMSEKEDNQVRFVLINQISSRLVKSNERYKQIVFLTDYVQKNPQDPYNGYYLALVAEAYEDLGVTPLAVHYYDRILNNHPDIFIRGDSIHYHCIKKLIRHTEVNEYRIEYYKELISRFEEYIDDMGQILYSLATTYESIGEWAQAIQVYQTFLKYPNTIIPGVPDVHKIIMEKVNFYYSKKSWTVASLDNLVSLIKNAIKTKNVAVLEKYKAKVNFFTMYWGQKNYDKSRASFFHISTFLYTSDVLLNEELDIDSNSNEAYLKTSRWKYRIPVWYLYLKRIDFPADPEIDGRWEWAGIYFGEKS